MVEFVSFGDWVRRRRKALDLTQAALAHQVGCATITIRKIESDERKPSRTMAGRLSESLMIPAVEREDFIRTGLGETPTHRMPVPSTPISQIQAPVIHQFRSKSDYDHWGIFVGRESELAWLGDKLDSTIKGEGQIVFIAGDAGRGKTALMVEFARRALRQDTDLMVSGGTCNAFAGAGDPYLPFRELIGFLSGDFEVNWTPGAHSTENTHRIWQFLPTTLQTLIEFGPHLLDVFVQGRDLLSRANQVAPGGATWVTQIQSEVNRQWRLPTTREQSAIFGQFTNVLRQVSNHLPLILTLDDLQWADDASLGLLFHLSRRLAGSRILILGTYRPEELAHDLGGNPHPLQGLLGEFQRTYGDITIDLAASDRAGGKDFVASYLNILPNRLSDTFQLALYNRTQGHPLFTVELLREMQTRGDLIQDSSDIWYEAEELDWDTLPARVEAVITQRLSRLEEPLREILTIGCIEGETFTAEVVAQVLGIDERTLLQRLSQQLDKRHHLVRVRGEIILTDRHLSPYQFSHALFQHYIYEQLDSGVRRRLHGEVASALETLYQDQVDSIAAQLAWHFQEAHMPQRAVEYLSQAGEKAIRLYGYEEALSLLNRGLSMLKTLPTNDLNIQQELKMRLLLGEAQYKIDQLAEALETFQDAAAIARKIKSPEDLARAAIGYEKARWMFSLPFEPALDLLIEALDNLDEGDSVLKVRVRVSLVRTLMSTGSPEQYENMSRQVIETARRVGDPIALSDALYVRIRGDRRPESSEERLAAIDEILQLIDNVGETEFQPEILTFRLLENLERGDMKALSADWHTYRRLSEKFQRPLFTYGVWLFQVMMALFAGHFEKAEQLANEALITGRQMGVENVDGIYGIQIFTIRREQGRLREIAPIVKLFIEQHSSSAAWGPGLAIIYSELGLKSETLAEFESLAANDFSDLPQDALWVTCIAYLSEVCAYLGDVDRAFSLYQLLLPYDGRTIVAGFFSVCLGAVSRYLGILSATMSRWDDAETHFEKALKLNTRIAARPWLAHTQYQFAIMLLSRGHTKDKARAMSLLNDALEIAQELGMKSLAEKVVAYKG